MADPLPKADTSPVKASNDSNNPNKSSSRDAHEAIDKRAAQEIIIGLCGPIGSGIKSVEAQLTTILKEEHYEVHIISVSQVIESFFEQISEPLNYSKSDKSSRYNELMNAGNNLRNANHDSICADLAITRISDLRGDTSGENFEVVKSTALKKKAYIVNQLKHPAEVKALNKIYGNLFYLIGILCDEDRRKQSLMDEGITDNEAYKLIMRDKKENDDHGQQLEKTLFHADFFINNSDPNSSTIKSLLSRFFKLVHGRKGITPTKEEYGMYAAHTASLQSACLSRQVGAAITNEEGVVVSVGHNDVPKFGGGLYSEDDNISPYSKDSRCVHRDQRCHNDLHKQRLKQSLEKILHQELNKIDQLNIDANKEVLDEVINTIPALADSLYKNSQIKSIIEYSRAIHAEMDAIISLGRTGAGIGSDSTIYTTTFPCHNCARHIVAAGISNVVYIEPYEKSLALSLHDDTLSHKKIEKKVWLKPFQGVAPSRYQAFFKNTTPIKDDEGKIIWTDRLDQLQVDKTFVDSYLEHETRIAAKIKLLKNK